MRAVDFGDRNFIIPQVMGLNSIKWGVDFWPLGGKIDSRKEDAASRH